MKNILNKYYKEIFTITTTVAKILRWLVVGIGVLYCIQIVLPDWLIPATYVCIILSMVFGCVANAVSNYYFFVNNISLTKEQNSKLKVSFIATILYAVAAAIALHFAIQGNYIYPILVLCVYLIFAIYIFMRYFKK